MDSKNLMDRCDRSRSESTPILALFLLESLDEISITFRMYGLVRGVRYLYASTELQ